jgi:hypothetical protein
MSQERWNPTSQPIPTHEGGIGPSEVKIPEDDEDNVFLDTFGMQFDRHFELVHGIESWLDANPGYRSFTYVPDQLEPNQESAEVAFSVDRNTALTIRKRVGLTRYEYLTQHSELGKELARDITKSWEKPEEHDEH